MTTTRGFIKNEPIEVESPLFADGDPCRIRYAGSGGSIVADGAEIDVPTASTSSVVFVDLMSVPVVVHNVGDLQVDFSASIQITPPAAAAIAEGVALQFLYDGTPFGSAFFQIDPGVLGTIIDTFAEVASLSRRIPSGIVGPHTLEVQWAVFDATSSADTFAGVGSLQIGTAVS